MLTKIGIEIIKDFISEYKSEPIDYLVNLLEIILFIVLIIPFTVIFDILLLPLELIAFIIYKKEWNFLDKMKK